jgi:hypothetical protein
MTLNEQQWKFSRMVADLIQEANHQGFEIALGEAHRPAFTAAYYALKGLGVKDSFHTKRLAIDLMLFKGGIYLTQTEDYATLGAYWTARGGTWGGRFRRPDGNHFSLGEGK